MRIKHKYSADLIPCLAHCKLSIHVIVIISHPKGEVISEGTTLCCYLLLSELGLVASTASLQ